MRISDIIKMSERLERRGVLHHPVLLYISSKLSIRSSPSLKSYIVKVMKGEHPVPRTLTQFYREYFADQLRDFMDLLSRDQAKKVDDEHVDNVMDILGKLAFDDVVKQKPVTRKVLKKAFKNADLNNVSFLSYGLLHEDVKGSKYVFKETLLQEYLMARYQFRLVLKKLQKGSTNKRDLYDSVYMLPNTTDAWVVMFGMMADNDETARVLRKLLAHVIRKMKKSMIVKNKDITCFCLQVVFETRNKGDVASTLDLFTRNETVDLVSLALPQQKVSYFMSALGFIVEVTKMYGLQIEDFQLNENSLGLLTDPANEVSDNNLQFLSLSTNPLGSAGVRKLQPFLVKASLLTWLDLSSCQLKNTGVVHFSYIIECMPLIWLNLANNEISDKGAEAFAKHLRLCPTMQEFSLASNQITDEGAHSLAGAIEDLPQIKKVILTDNCIGEEGEMSLTSAALKIAMESSDDAEARRVNIILEDKLAEHRIFPEIVKMQSRSPYDDISVGTLSKMPSQHSLDSTGSWGDDSKPDPHGTIRSLPPEIDKTSSLRRSIGGGSLARRRVIAQSLRRLQQPLRPRLNDSTFTDPNVSGGSVTPRPVSSLSRSDRKYHTLPSRTSNYNPPQDLKNIKPTSTANSPQSPDDAMPRPKVDLQVNGVPMIVSPEDSGVVMASPNSEEVKAVIEAVDSPDEGIVELQKEFTEKMKEAESEFTGQVEDEITATVNTDDFAVPTSIADDFSESVLRSINQETSAFTSDVNNKLDEAEDKLNEGTDKLQEVAENFNEATDELVDKAKNELADDLQIVEDTGNTLIEDVQFEGKQLKHSLEADGVIDVNMNGNINTDEIR